MKVTVVGSGAWGTALAIRLHKNGHDVTLWTFEKDLIPQMETERVNIRLPQAKLPLPLRLPSWTSSQVTFSTAPITSESLPTPEGSMIMRSG